MTDSLRPTKKQRELLDFIESFIGQHGYSPSYREIMNGLQYNSVATVALHVGNLIKRGHLQKRDHSARSLEVVRRTVAGDTDVSESHDDDVHENWLVGRVESYLRQAASRTQTDSYDESQLLLEALRLLGLQQQADSLQNRLALQPVPIDARQSDSV